MPIALTAAQKFNPDGTGYPSGSWFAIADSKNRGAQGRKVEGFNFHEYEKTGKPGRSFQSAAVAGCKASADGGRRTDKGKGARFTSRDCGIEGIKQHGSGPIRFDQGIASLPSSSSRRKAASAQIAKIPFQLARHIAEVYREAR